MTTYNPGIPLPGDNISTSQGQIKDNFTVLNTVFASNHYAWNDSVTSNQGLHRKVDFPATTTIVSAPVGLASVIYSKDVSNVPCPYFRNSVNDYSMWFGGTTGSGLVSETLASPGKLNLPNGMQMRWGIGSVGGGGTGSISFSPAFDNNCFNVQATVERNGANVTIAVAANPTKNAFTAYCAASASPIAASFFYFAIGN